MKKTNKKLISLLLCAIMAFGAVIPAFAAEQPEAEPTWQGIIESVTPVGDEPCLALELTPKGYIFTDYYIPREYDVAMTDGTTERVRIPRKEVMDLYNDGSHVGEFFCVDAGGETITLYACIIFNEETKQSIFEIGQFILAPMEQERATLYKPYYCTISSENCRTEIDDGSMIARILYPIFSVFYRILWFFSEIRYRISN